MFDFKALPTLLLVLLFALPSKGQFVVIDKIQINGDHKTRRYVIHRELTVNEGDTVLVENIPNILKESKANLFNTKLFNEVEINWRVKGLRNIIEVDLIESWYIYPALIFELADRNFNVWWSEQNRDLSRVNLGGRLDYNNLTGNRDKLKLKAQFGYTQKYEVGYSFPYLNKKKTLGISFGALYSSNNEIGYRTVGNKIEFFQSDSLIYKRLRLSSALIFRPEYNIVHTLKAEYHNYAIDKLVVENLNRLFFINERTDIRYYALELAVEKATLDQTVYPLDGKSYGLSIRKEGLGVYQDVDRLTTTITGSVFKEFYPKWSGGARIKGRYQILRNNPGYFHNKGLGFSDNQLRGYEYYVVDGLDYAFGRTHLKFELINKDYNLGKLMFIQQFRKVQTRLYLVASLDMGYVSSPYFNVGNELNNSVLIGGGPGVHLLIYNNFLFRFEYSLNRLGESGLFIHINTSF